MGLLDFLFGKKDNLIQEYIEKKSILLDVRTESEYNNGSIKDAKHIALSKLKNHVDELKKLNKPIIIYCASGIRSGKAAKYLAMNSIDAINGGGMNSLKKVL